MESLAIGSLCKPSAMIQYSGVVKPSSSLVLKHQACIFDKNRYMTFQQRHVNYHMAAESFYKRSMLHGRPEKKFELDATSTNDPGSDAAHMNPMQITVNFLDVLYRFIRPYAALGTALNVASMALLAVEKLSDFTPLFFVRLLQALVGSLLMQMYVTGFNQICDIELDKVNKPFLPLAAGDLSMRTAIIVSSLSAIMSLSIAWITGSAPLFWCLVGWFLVGTAYSANVLPLLRWKRFPLTAALYMLMARVLMLPVGCYMHMKNSIHGRSILLSRQTLFAFGILSMFSIAIIFFKDIPDIKGDRMHGIKSLASRLGQTRMFWSCIWVLEITYIVVAFVGATSSVTWSKYVTIFGHLTMASLLWMRAKSVDLKSKEDIQSMYMFLWQLFYAEYCLLPFLR